MGPLSPKLEAFRFFLEGSTVDQDSMGMAVKNFDFCVEVEKFKSMVSATVQWLISMYEWVVWALAVMACPTPLSVHICIDFFHMK